MQPEKRPFRDKPPSARNIRDTTLDQSVGFRRYSWWEQSRRDPEPRLRLRAPPEGFRQGRDPHLAGAGAEGSQGRNFTEFGRKGNDKVVRPERLTGTYRTWQARLCRCKTLQNGATGSLREPRYGQ